MLRRWLVKLRWRLRRFGRVGRFGRCAFLVALSFCGCSVVAVNIVAPRFLYAELVVATEGMEVDNCAQQVLLKLEQLGLIT